MRAVQEAVRPDKAAIIGLDTLAEEGSNHAEVKGDAEGGVSRRADELGYRGLK